MGSSSFSMLLAFFLLFIAALVISSRATVAEASLKQSLRWVPTRHHCQGSIAECMGAGDDEFEMDSEINRRILATTQYISYGALQRNSVPCSLRGASYYNCKPGAQSNPYTHGCGAITRCRS
ncbi:hypothetical protein FH972_005951 [Carpinus fangiana]|uniref:Rapid alkalinization factor 1 n=1 Tax=Carpinus fangiana TaxID=176857 RepID=A0A5N6QU26_9ROSI|nr:hypothetical protein FH972_005951 [Carpinus fangiana]